MACYAWQLLEAPKTAEEASSEDGIALALQFPFFCSIFTKAGNSQLELSLL